MSSQNLLRLFAILPFVVHFAVLPFAVAQYAQDFTWQYTLGTNGAQQATPFWSLNFPQAPVQGLLLDPGAIVLQYNCYYMQDICVNADKFQRSQRGQNRPWPNIFAYQVKSRGIKNRRGRAMCPSNWKLRHSCPEAGTPSQKVPMRNDGRWFTSALEPGTSINQLMNRRDSNGRVIENSKIRYTCDEFPPKSFIEGGIGPNNPSQSEGPGQTRCAAMRCDRVRQIKSEQNWQGAAHIQVGVAVRRFLAMPLPNLQGFNPTNGFVMVHFNMISAADGIAARVFIYEDAGDSNTVDVLPITQVKRSRDWNYMEWLNSITPEKLTAMGPLRETRIHANITHTQITHIEPKDTGIKKRALDHTSGDIATQLTNHDEPQLNITSLRAASQRPKAEFKHLEQKRDISHPSIRPLLKRASVPDVEKAHRIVEDALAKVAKLNAARYKNPVRNKYALRPGTIVGDTDKTSAKVSSDDSEVPALLAITDQIAEAAALVSEAESASSHTEREVSVAASGSFWMEHIDRKGTVPWGDDPDYKVFRNVLDYGAIGDGVTDDTKAIKKAVNEGKRCAAKCNGSTTKNAIIYFPPGKYLISSTIPLPFGTQVIGDANKWPILKASKSFIGLGVLSVNEYTGGGTGADGLAQQWYINTANFYRQIRNIKIDITLTRSASQVAGLHYQVAQATSLQNVEIIAKPGTKQRGIFAENGSGGVMSDVTFRGGEFGLYGGEQQFTAQRLTFEGCETGVQIIWDWGWIWKSITMKDVGVAFRLESEAEDDIKRKRADDTSGGKIGSISIYDSSFSGADTVVLIAPPSAQKGSGSTGIVIENTKFTSIGKAVADTSGKTILKASGKIDHWALGPIYSPEREFSEGDRIDGFRRDPGLLDKDGNYFERMKPQYEDMAVSDFLHVKDFGAKGNGKTDDTEAFQKALYSAQGKILFVDAGSYIITKTITVPAGSKIVGETWSQLVASGDYFSNPKEPKVMIQVGRVSEVGNIEMQDIIFTNRGPTAGLIHVEWNIQASKPGSAGLWDCHVRVGGATGTDLTPKECPPLTTGVAQGCNAGSLMMHITSEASGYFENMWLWVADHMIDDPELDSPDNLMVQNSVYVARGLLVESTRPTWLYGTSAEHAVFYQYNFHEAKSIFAGMIQTESPYYQPTPKPPAPFKSAVGVMAGDPDYTCAAGDEFSGCDQSWALIIRKSARIMIAGAGMYSWFSTYAQDCIDSQRCQKVLMFLEENSPGVRLQQIITIGAKYMGVQDGVAIKASDNLNVEIHPRWSQVSVWDVTGDGTTFEKAVWIDPKIWEMDQPAFTCSPPCYAKLPPWKGATRTVNYPILTVSSGTWTSRITRAPLTITDVMFDVVTFTAGSSKAIQKRQPFGEFWPTPITTPNWPVVTYRGPNGARSTTAPKAKFPAPPASIGPGAPPPAQGSWPTKAVKAVLNTKREEPLVSECAFPDFGCQQNPWEYGGFQDPPKAPEDDDDDDYDENEEDGKVICPDPTSTTTTTDRPDPTEEPISLPEPSPMENRGRCYNYGTEADHARINDAVYKFCGDAADDGDVLRDGWNRKSRYDYSLEQLWTKPPLSVEIWLGVRDSCQFQFSYGECVNYGQRPIDACDCDSKDGKHGGEVQNDCIRMYVMPMPISAASSGRE